MDIKQLGKSMEHANIQPHSNSAHNRIQNAQKEATPGAPVDQISLGNKGQEDFGTYKIDGKKLAQIKQDFHKNTESFRVMVRSMIEKQGGNVNEILRALANGEEVTIKVDAETKQSAQEAIAEDGYWGVNQTSERILEFAKTISGGDKSKIDTLINAFKEGFEAAREAFGGTLPEISQKTFDKVMEGFEAWKAE